MKLERQVIITSILLGILVWVVDAALDSHYFYEGSLLDLLILDVPKHEIYIRSFILAVFTLFGIITSAAVSKRKRVERSLLEERSFSESVLQSSPTFFVAISPAGQTLMMNGTMLRALGYEKDEVLGTNYLETFVPEDDRRLLLSMFNNLGDFNEVVANQSRVLTKDGRELLLEWHTRPMVKENGELDYFFSVGIDIMERKKWEDELRESEGRFRALFEGSLDAIFLEDPESGQILDANPAASELLLRPHEEIVGLYHSDLHPPYQVELSRKMFAEFTRDKGQDSSLEISVLRSDGTEVPVEILAQIVQINGVPVAQAVFRDITERRKMEEKTTRVQKIESLGILAGGIAHDFNNILTAICTNISMVRMYGNLEDDISQMVTDAENASLRAKKLTQQLLSFSKGGKPIKKTISLVQLLRDTAEFALTGSNVRSGYSIPEDLWLVSVDEGQISQVINNLVINADQAMPQGGTLVISANNVLVGKGDSIGLEKGKYVKVSVTDQGTGISQKHLSNIFDPFFTTKQKGSGLGLTTSFSIIRNHGGHIGVHSELDIGTTVDVYLPASEEAIETGEREKEGPIKGEGRVLLIDDDDMIRRSTGETLKRFGCDTKLAKDGEEGLNFYKNAIESGRPFDAVIMDLTIRGGKGGKETIEELMKINPDAKVIVSSGYSDDPVMSEYGAYGFVGVLEKPYRIKDLGALLRKIIAEERR